MALKTVYIIAIACGGVLIFTIFLVLFYILCIKPKRENKTNKEATALISTSILETDYSDRKENPAWLSTKSPSDYMKITQNSVKQEDIPNFNIGNTTYSESIAIQDRSIVDPVSISIVEQDSLNIRRETQQPQNQLFLTKDIRHRTADRNFTVGTLNTSAETTQSSLL